MLIKQLSVFMENREGRLEKVTEILKKHNINIISFSLADTSEYGILRMVVSDPEKGRKVLREEGFSASLTEIIALKTEQKPGKLNAVLKTIFDAGLSVEYMYPLATTGDDASIIMKLSDLDKAIEVLRQEGHELSDDIK